MKADLVLHQFDPLEPVAGGIDGFIRDFVRFAPPERMISIVGVDASGAFASLGRWYRVTIAGRVVRFMPVARLNAGDQSRRVPHTARLLTGFVRHWPDVRNCLVHTHRAEIGAAISLLHPNVSRIQYIHGDTREALQFSTETFWRFLPRLYEWGERRSVRTATCTFVYRAGAAARLQRYGSRVVAASNWFDDAVFYPRGERQADLRIGWVGRFEPPKDPLKALEVFSCLRRRDIRFSAWMAGTGTLLREVRAARSRLGLDGVVELPGLLTPEQLAQRFGSSTVTLMTSLWEGFPRVLVESLGSGVPVVSTDVGDVHAVVDEALSGFVNPTADADSLADLVVRAHSLTHGRAIAATVERFSARRVVPALFDAIASTA